MKTKISILFILLAIAVCCNSTKMVTPEINQNDTDATADFDAQITGKYWKLITLEGQDIIMSDNQEREVHVILNADSNRLQGFSGCNTFGGSFSLEKGSRINFSQLLSTLKACPDAEFKESEFLQIFEFADNYTVKDDTLMLNTGKRAPLAIFKAVYLK